MHSISIGADYQELVLSLYWYLNSTELPLYITCQSSITTEEAAPPLGWKHLALQTRLAC